MELFLWVETGERHRVAGLAVLNGFCKVLRHSYCHLNKMIIASVCTFVLWKFIVILKNNLAASVPPECQGTLIERRGHHAVGVVARRRHDS